MGAVGARICWLASRPTVSRNPRELGNPQYRAHLRNFRMPMVGKELTSGQRRFFGSFWLPN